MDSVGVGHTDILTVNRGGGATVYNCTYANNWCCDSGLVYGGCCSNPSNFLNIGAGKIVTQVGAAPFTSSTTVSTQISASTSLQSSSSSSSLPATSSSSSANSTTATQSGSGHISSTSGQGNSSTPSPSPSSSNLGVKVGAGVGIPAGLALVGALIYIVYLTRRNKRNQQLLNELADNQGHPGEDKSRAGQPLSFYSTTVAPSEMAESHVQLGETTGAELHGQGIERPPGR